MAQPKEVDTEQGYIVGMEPPRIAAIDRAAKTYRERRDERQAMLKKEVEAKIRLIDLMKEHKLKTYTSRGGLVVEFDVKEAESIKVSEVDDD